VGIIKAQSLTSQNPLLIKEDNFDDIIAEQRASLEAAHLSLSTIHTSTVCPSMEIRNAGQGKPMTVYYIDVYKIHTRGDF
jgi:hypothetical protein